MGAVASPGTTQLSPKDIAYRMNAAKATCFITDPANAAKLDQVAAECPTLKARILGAAAYHLAKVADGTGLASVEATPKIWDLAAVDVIVREAGGFVTELDGRANMMKSGDGGLPHPVGAAGLRPSRHAHCGGRQPPHHEPHAQCFAVMNCQV